MSLQTRSLFLFTITSTLILTACQASKPAAEVPNQADGPAVVTNSDAPAATNEVTVASDSAAPGARDLSLATTYQSPAGVEQVGFTLVVDKDGVITDAKTNVGGISPTSIRRQTAFAEGLPAVIKGKKLAELSNIDRVGGSSLTTGAFNAALATFKAKL